MYLVDAHLHLANLAVEYDIFPMLKEAEANNIGAFVSNALKRSEADWHLANPHANILWHAGIHPSFDECDFDLAYINKLASSGSIAAIGEIGLDRGNPDLAWQTERFVEQLKIAETYSLPVVLHLVGHPRLAFDIMNDFKLQYLVHGFAGSVESFENYCKLGCYFTISSRLLKPDKKDLLQAMCSYDKILFETDITRYYVKEAESNPLLRLSALIQDVSALSGRSIESLVQQQYRNFRQIWHIEKVYNGSV